MVRNARSQKIETRKVLAGAVAVFRLNGNKIVRFEQNKPGNKELVLEWLEGKGSIEVTEQDYEQADTIKSYLEQKVLMAGLVGSKINPFTAQIVELIAKAEVPLFSVGQLVWTPKLHEDGTKQDSVKETVNHFLFTSKYIGQEKDRVEINFHLLDCKYNNVYNCYRHVGHDGNGNLIGFLNKESIPDGVRIKARIKKCETSKYNGGAKTTFLNYVKVVA